MRIIALFLLVVNLALVAWFQFSSAAKNPVQLAENKQPGPSLNNLEMVKGPSKLTSEDLDASLACYQIGEFNDKNVADQVLARLKALEIGSTIRPVEREEIKDYWVYLRPFASFQAARKELASLNLQGVDSFIFAEGELRNGLSLGVFSSRVNASKVFERVTELGYNPQIRESFQTITTYHIKLDQQGSAFFNQSIEDTILSRYPGIEVAKAAC